jgi:adenylate cyclase
MAEEPARRRLAAILVADVVEYSRLMQLDEAGTLAALKARRSEILRPLVSKHHSRIVKLMGDGVLIEFASAVNAVQCAVQLQEAIAASNEFVPEDRRIVLRVGVNLGDVMVEGSDLYGDGVNIAARLESIAAPGSVYVSQTVFGHVRGKVELQFDDLGERSVKNMADPLRVYRVHAGIATVDEAETRRPAKTSRPSIAVLPFTNMSDDPAQEYFSDGITEDIITELSRFRNLFVIARNSSFAYKGKSVKIAAIARELGVEYILEGSVRRAGQRVRITAQLIDAASGNHVWAERYDRELVDIFAVQDEVTSSIVGTLAVELEDVSLERARHKHPENLQAYEHWLRGKRLVFLMGSYNLEARRHFQSAIAVDPSFSRAHSGLALTYQMEAFDFPLPNDARIAWEKAFQHANKALVLDETNHQAHLALAYSYLYRRDYDQVKKHIERAIKLNPSDGDTLSHAAYLLAILGESEESIKFGRTALRLNPHPPDWYLSFLAHALFTARRYPEALTLQLRTSDTMLDSPFYRAATLAHMGRLDEARQCADKAVAKLAATPGGALAITDGRVVDLILDNNPDRRQEDRDHIAEGMRKAGVPG